MQRKSNTLLLLAAILAFVPVMASDFIVDNFVRAREGAVVQRSVNALAEDAQSAVYDAINSMGDLLAASPSLCTPSFADSLRALMLKSQYLRQVVVENSSGVEYCNAFGGDFDYSIVSDPVSIPGRPETVTAVEFAGSDMPVLKITRMIDSNRRLSAFVNFSDMIAAGRRPVELIDASFIHISFANGTDLLTLGDGSVEKLADHPDKYLFATSLAGDVPIRVEIAISFSILRAEYSDLYVLFTFVASMMSAAFLILALQYVRKSNGTSLNLERAIVNGEIKPWYQPVIDLETGRVAGCEMLARWVKPNGEVIPPNVFIEYAEVTGLAIPMTITLMEHMRDDVTPLIREFPDLKFSLNLFEGHFRDGTVVEDIEAIFGGSAIPFKQLVFEITERQPLDDDVKAMTVINGLHALGAKLALDDIGTGHSNLAYIQTLGVDVLKIDRVFVSAVQDENSVAPVLDALITMADKLGAQVVAEGVETIEQAKFLKARGVTQVQGYLFSKPVPYERYAEMVRALNAPGAIAGYVDQDPAENPAAA